jgi:hypothetical protein
MLKSGTHAPGVPPSAFDPPAGTALRFEQPDPRIADYVTDYYALDSDGEEHMGAVEWSMPASANIRLFLGERPVHVMIGKRIYAPTPVAALYGPSSHALRVESFGGLTIGMGVSALGWSRLFAQPASRFRDRIVPLAEAMPARLANAMFEALHASDRSLEIKQVLDTFLIEHLGPPHPDEARIRQLMTLIVDRVDEIAVAAERMELTSQRLRQIALRHFGFPPKRLMRRARFLQSLLRMYAAGEADYSLVSNSYFDVSHFLRDAEEFLGTTPRRFMAMQTPYLRQVLRARQAVFGAPAQALHRVGEG